MEYSWFLQLWFHFRRRRSFVTWTNMIQINSENYLPVIHYVFLYISFIVIIISNIVILKSVRSSEGYPPHPSTTRVSGEQGERASGEQVSNNVVYKTRASSRGRQLAIMLISDSLTIVHYHFL